MPRVRMTPWKKAALYLLELYLVVLFGLIVVRFFVSR